MPSLDDAAEKAKSIQVLPKLRMCETCGEEKTATTLNFAADPDRGVSSLDKVCLECRQEESKQEEAEAISDRIHYLDHNLLRQMMQADFEASPALTNDFADLYEQIMGAYGGSKRFAERIVMECLAARPGSAIRLSYMKMTLQMSMRVAEMKQQETQNLDMLTEEELVEKLNAVLGKKSPPKLANDAC